MHSFYLLTLRILVRTALGFQTSRLPEAAPGSLSTNPSDDRVCFESWNSWRLADGRWRESLLFATEYITTSWSASYRIQQPVGEGFLYSDCDGIPRFGFHSPPTKSTYTTVTVTQSALQHAVNQNLNYTVFSEGSPEPNCTVSDSFCEKFLQAEALKQSESGADEFAYMNGQGLSRLNRPCTFCHLDSNAEVILIYWPPALTSRDICAKNGYGTAITVSHSDTVPKTATMDAITFNGIGVKRIDATDGSFLDLRKHYCRSISSTFTSPASGGKESNTGITSSELDSDVFVLTGPFTFTSPTVYLAHHAIEVMKPSDSYYPCPISVRPPGTVALKPTDVYTIRPRIANFNGSGLEYAHLVAQGAFRGLGVGLDEIQTLDYGNLQDPVPASLYYDARSDDCWPNKQTHCGTITDGTYRPQLAFNIKFWASLIPRGFECQRPRWVDPPIALLPIYATTLASPVLTTTLPLLNPLNPSAVVTMAMARPGSHITGYWSSPTASITNHNGWHGLSADLSHLGGARATGLPGDPLSIASDHNSMISGNIGLHPISASIMSGILVGAFMGTSTFHKGQSITIDGKVISFGDSGIFVDGIIAVPATRTVGGGGIHEVGAHDSKFSNPGGVFSSGEGLDADGNKTDAFTSGSGYRNGVSALIFALAAFMVTM